MAHGDATGPDSDKAAFDRMGSVEAENEIRGATLSRVEHGEWAVILVAAAAAGNILTLRRRLLHIQKVNPPVSGHHVSDVPCLSSSCQVDLKP
jgi:phosphatidylserine decarboxylase